jgi:hypothetical protein
MGRKKITNRSVHKFSLHVSQIQCDLKDVAYWIHKKEGFPSLTDQGVMDIFLGGHGLSFDIRFATAEAKDSNRIFKVDNVNVKLQNMKIVLKQSKFKTLFSLFRPLLMAVVKPAIQKAAEIQIRRTFDKVDEQMWLVQKEYTKAKEAAKNQPPEEAQNMIKMYINAIEKRITELRDKADEKKPDAKVFPSEAITNHSLMSLPTRRNRSSPTSISQVVFRAKLPNTDKWLVKARNGDLLSLTLAPPRRPPMSPHPRRSHANLPTAILERPSMIVPVP